MSLSPQCWDYKSPIIYMAYSDRTHFLHIQQVLHDRDNASITKTIDSSSTRWQCMLKYFLTNIHQDNLYKL